MMSAAGTPSTDPWVILARERVRYEEQFRSLKPNNGIVTGDQAKGFFLQSQLPPMILGQIWALADTDADGKMDINEFSIACKLINLKLRGFEVPKGLPPSLLASLKVNTPPAIPPLPNTSVMNAPPRPEPPKPPLITSQPIIPQMPPQNQTAPQPLIPGLGASAVNQPLLAGINTTAGMTTVQPISGIMPPAVGIPPPSTIPTGVVAPMPTNVSTVQPLIGGLSSAAPPLARVNQPTGFSAPLVPGLPLTGPSTMPVAPLVPGIPSTAPLGTAGVTIPPAAPLPPLAPIATATPVGASLTGIGSMSPVLAPPTSAPGATSTPRASIGSLDRTHSIESVPQPEWSVPHQTKLKYTQIFNTTDRTRSGFLSGAQARNVMVQTKLPQNILAQIWALSDMDCDGRLGCEEFVLALHLCEQAAAGTPPPTRLPPDLVPPSFRRTTSSVRTASISSQGSVSGADQDPAATLLQNSFEDKRKENFEKGQAELERRRKALLDQQRQEREERERKEREELEKREKARREAERKRVEELERQMREQQEKEKREDEDRRRQAEQREAARKEMERQRQLEWEKQRLQELQQQRQREQENVLKLKAKNQSLTIELTSLNDQVKELSQKICDTRMGVSNVKMTIDGMRSTRDSQMQEMSQLKNKLKEQNARLLALSQEKIKLEAKNKINTLDSEQARLAFENKEVTIKNLRKKVEDMQLEIDGKLSDIENNNSQLTELKTQMKMLTNECEQLYSVYEQKKDTVLEMKNMNRNNDLNTWSTNEAWGGTDNNEAKGEWPVDNWSATATSPDDTAAAPGVAKYRALYEFVARNNDEISFQPGDIVNVPTNQTGEPGWLAGEIRGHTGWFPESYVEPVDGAGIREGEFTDETEATRLEGIAEVPEGSDTTNSLEPGSIQNDVTPVAQPEMEPEYYISNYPYQSQEQGDLTFNAGEVIAVIKKEGDWWTGKLGDNVGIFPSNYVQKVDVNSSAVNEPVMTQPAIASNMGISAEAIQSALESVADNEVSRINDESRDTNKEIQPLDANIQASSQVVKSKKPEIASVIAPYQSSSPEQLSLARGQLIMIRKKTDSGWWEGELQAKGRKRQVGWFPASYVKVLNSSGKISGRSTPVSTTRMQQEVVIDKVIALYPFTAGNPDELTFAKDDIISVTAREEEAWWRGELNGISGLFPSNYVAPLQQQSPRPLSGQDKKRQDSIREFIQTEKSYVNDLTVVHEVFEVPLRNSKLISAAEVDGIFVNWQEIIQCNRIFMEELLRAQNIGSDTVGDIICDHLPRMTAYITFCRKQLDSAASLQKLTENSTAFRNLVKKCQNNVITKGMPLSSFLIKPMQRITKYPLLINKILENTDPDHPDHKYLQEASRLADKFLNSINENVRIKENQERLDWVQQCVQNDLNLVFNSQTNKLGTRQLLHFGIFMKLKGNKELIGFLFNDFFMLVQPSKNIGSQFMFQRNSNVTYKLYKQPILIQNLVIKRESSENIESGTDSNRLLNIQDDKTMYKISLVASTVHECSMWTKKIENAKEHFVKISSDNRNKRKTLPYSRKWLCLTVVEGREISKVCSIRTSRQLGRKGKSHYENIYCKVTLGSQEQETDIGKENISNGNISSQNGLPQIPVLVWNYSMQFQLRNINQEVLTFIVLEKNSFTPDEFLGRAELRMNDILRESQNHNGPITKKLILHQVESGEIVVKLDMHLFNNF